MLTTLELPRQIVDFETFSHVDVTDCGAWRYAEDPTTEILCMAYGPPKTEPKLWTPELPFPQELIDHVLAGYVIEAHNVQFEMAVWFHQLYKKLMIPMPDKFVDTIASCAHRAIPLGLDKVGKVLNLPVQKDKRGKYLLQKLSLPQKITKKNPTGRCQEWELYEELYNYCKQDHRSESMLGDTIGDLPMQEYNIWKLDQLINNRGVAVDVEAILACKTIIDEVYAELTEELSRLTGGKVTSGAEVAKIGAWCAAEGFPMPNLQADTIEYELAQDYLPDNVRRVLEIRQQLSLASIKKIEKFVNCYNADGRIRGLLQYHGAATGRWAGRLVQPQNFPRSGHKFDKKSGKGMNMEDAIAVLKTGDAKFVEDILGMPPLEAVSMALRGMFIPSPGHEFFVCDFAAIEARVVMWVAGQADALEAFFKFDNGEGEDIYCVFAESIYKRPINKKDNPDERQLGKIGVLGCGYQMGWSKLQMQAETAYGIKLTDEQAQAIVNAYRSTYSEVKDFWYNIESAAIACVEDRIRTKVGMITFEYVTDKAGNWLTMILPNGRKLWYFNPEISERPIQFIDKETGLPVTRMKRALSYEGRDNKRGGAWGRIYTYGGMLTENAVQAIARDLMAEAMMRAELAGYKVVLTIHDEIVAERLIGEGNEEEFNAIIRGPTPKWATGCPINVEGKVLRRYQKI